MKILITGGSGFIGTNLMDYYLSKGVDIVNLDITSPMNPEHKSYWKEMDVLNMRGLRTAIANFSPTHIVNLAAKTGMIDKRQKLENYASNIQGVKNLISATNDIPSLKKIIFISSMAVCKIGYSPQNETDYCPDTLYGKSKMLGEKVIRQTDIAPYSWVIVRPTGIWGPWSHEAYTTLFKLIQKGFYVHPAGVNINYSLGFVGNTVSQLDKLIQAPSVEVHGKTFYLADCPPINMRVWTNLIQKAFGAQRIREVPIWALKVVAAIGDAMKLLGWDYPLLSSSRLKNMLTSFAFDLDPTITKNQPYELEEAIQMTVAWIREEEKASQPYK